MKKLLSILLVVLIATASMLGCNSDEQKQLTYEEAVAELNAFNEKLTTDTRPLKLDIYGGSTASVTLSSIDNFPFSVIGNGEINIEIAVATEMSKEKAPDDLGTILAKNFNKMRMRTESGKIANVSIRTIASGEAFRYMTQGDYRPDAFIPSSWAWGEMLRAEGVDVIKITDRIAGNTAGILMQKDTYKSFVDKYQAATIDKVLEAATNGDLTFAYTNPYVSSTGLNALVSMLYAFDNHNPLSQAAQDKLLEYQKNSPPVAYTTAEMRESAADGLVSAMVMEEQSYLAESSLKDYIYVPFGIRHDHPVYTFDYVSAEKQEVARMFTEYCLSDEAQQLANQKNFNLHNDYVEQNPGLDGLGYLSAQKIWKLNKDGGRPIIAVFVVDISYSMHDNPINAAKDALVAAASFIGPDNYVGLVSYSTQIHIDLPIAKFDSQQRAYFSGAAKALSVEADTATYSATLVALKMLLDKQAEIPDAKLMLFVMTDGQQNTGYTLDRIAPIIQGLQIPVTPIGYNIAAGSQPDAELKRFAALIDGCTPIYPGPDNVLNELQSLFNAKL